MATTDTGLTTHQKPLRLWPGIAIVTVQWMLWAGIPLVAPDQGGLGVLSGIACGLFVAVWWLLFSRAPWTERVGALVLLGLAVLVTSRFVHVSISNGMMGWMLPVYFVPFWSLALVAGAAAGRGLPRGRRLAALGTAVALACGMVMLLRTSGVTGGGGANLHWRWTMTPEQRLLARGGDEPVARPAAPVTAPAPATATPAPPATATRSTAASETTKAPEKHVAAPAADPARSADSSPVKPAVSDPGRRAEWPGFRGATRDGVIRGVTITTDWSASPPVELWRRPIGPGWSSFAVSGDLFYTQEQRGDDELVSCYRLSSGEPVWRHRDAVRFYESNGGPGPRATPALHNGRVYTHGATGVVNALDAESGAVVWSRNSSADTEAPMPGWGFTSSPLVVDDAVIVASSGRLVAYEIATGRPRWVQKTGGGGYSSPHRATIDGVAQVLLLSGGGVTSVAPADGSILWQHAWQEGVGIVQPAVMPGGGVLLSAGDMMGGTGMRRLAIARTPPGQAQDGSAGWTAEERWTTRGLKPYFNDFVVHKGHAFGFDGTILSCIGLEDGERKWKGGRYGAGQMILLPDQDVILVLSEDGELALVSATPDKFTEIARFKAIEGKTWNHPVLAGDVLLVRNGEEMAAFRLSRAGR